MNTMIFPLLRVTIILGTVISIFKLCRRIKCSKKGNDNIFLEMEIASLLLLSALGGSLSLTTMITYNFSELVSLLPEITVYLVWWGLEILVRGIIKTYKEEKELEEKYERQKRKRRYQKAKQRRKTETSRKRRK